MKTSEKQEATSCGGEVERENHARLVHKCCVVLLDNCAIGKERKRESVEHKLLHCRCFGEGGVHQIVVENPPSSQPSPHSPLLL